MPHMHANIYQQLLLLPRNARPLTPRNNRGTTTKKQTDGGFKKAKQRRREKEIKKKPYHLFESSSQPNHPSTIAGSNHPNRSNQTSESNQSHLLASSIDPSIQCKTNRVRARPKSSLQAHPNTHPPTIRSPTTHYSLTYN